MNDQHATVLAAGVLARYVGGHRCCGTWTMRPGEPAILPGCNVARA